MSDTDTSSTNVIVSKANKSNRKLTPLTIGLFIISLAVVIILVSWFVIDRSNSNKINSALSSAKQANNHDQPLVALDDINKVESMRMTNKDQEAALIDKMTSYSLLGEYGGATTAAEQAYNLTPSNTSLLLTIAQLAQTDNDTQTAITYYKKAIAILGNIPESKQGLTYKSDLDNLQIQLKALEQ